ncbi:hypothetical protein CCMA1212_008986 [Trichoderma ghanense]|uniref:Uncharacterized protein n=1 Tax=Trichoderma ghanense TaxID=65468 RepID=A0ABY2GUJ8_9HYPO
MGLLEPAGARWSHSSFSACKPRAISARSVLDVACWWLDGLRSGGTVRMYRATPNQISINRPRQYEPEHDGEYAQMR